MKRALLILCLLIPAASSAAERVIPSIALPKRLGWDMPSADCTTTLHEQGIAIGDPKRLVQPDWYGTPGWTRASGTWTSTLFDDEPVDASLYYDAAGGLQCVEVVVKNHTAKYRTRELEPYARKIHAELGNKYHPCSPRDSTLQGHRCSWQDELGFAVTFTFDCSWASRNVLTVRYSSAAYRRALEDRSEF